MLVPKKKKKKGGKRKKSLVKVVATTSLPAVNRPNDTARMTTAGMPHARAKIYLFSQYENTSIIISICYTAYLNSTDAYLKYGMENQVAKFKEI